MSVDKPSWFTGDWPLESGDEPTSSHFEDLRKFLFCASYPYAGTEDYSVYANSDIKDWTDYFNGAGSGDTYDSGTFFGYYGTMYILVDRDETANATWLLANLPTTECDDTDYGSIVSHEDATINTNWELAALTNYYQHWDVDSACWIVRLNRSTAGGQNAYDCQLPAYKWLPQQTLPAKFPPVGLEIDKNHINQINRTLWARDRSVYIKHYTECTLDGPEPFDDGVTTDEQDHYNPLMSNEDGLTAYQDYARHITELTGGYYLVNIQEDTTWQATFHIVSGEEWSNGTGSGVNYAVGDIVWNPNDTGDERLAATTKYVCHTAHNTTDGNYKPPDSDGNNGEADWADMWLEDAYQPERIETQPMWVPWQNDWNNCNSSGHERILKEVNHFDWYWCATADGNHPAIPDWLADYQEDHAATLLPEPIGCWRRFWKNTFGKPKDSSEDYLDDWKVWPGSNIPPGGYSYKLLVSQATYTSTATSHPDWIHMYAVAPTDAEIETAYNLLDSDAKAACLKRHDPIQIIAVWDLDADPVPAYVDVEQFEIYAEAVQDIWEVLSNMEYIDGDKVVTVTVGRRYQGDEYLSSDYGSSPLAMAAGVALVEADSYQSSVEASYITCGYNIGVSNIFGSGVWKHYGGTFAPDGFNEDIFRQTFYASVALASDGSLAIDLDDLQMRLRYKGVEYVGGTWDSELFSSCEIGVGDVSLSAEPVDTDTDTAIIYNTYLQLTAPLPGTTPTLYTGPLIDAWPTDLAYLINFAGSGLGNFTQHLRATMVDPTETTQNYYIIARMDWDRYDTDLDVFDTPPDPILT